MALETLAIVSERAPGEPGGLAVAAERIAKHAAQSGVRVHLVSWSKLAPPGARSVAEHAGVTLHVDNLRGDNAHHQCETIFKAFGRALRMAAERDERAAGTIPSTKGAL